MAKSFSVKWNGAKSDPDSVTQYGVEFPKGEFVSVPADHPRIDKIKNNPQFETKGYDQPDDSQDDPFKPARSTPAIAPGVEYHVERQGNGKGKPSTYIVVSSNGDPVADQNGVAEEYVDEESAQNIADAMNKAVPAQAS